MVIKSLKLEKFRQFLSQKFKFSDSFTVIQGMNTYGKSSIIEAIHILLNGESPYTSTLTDAINSDNEYFRIEADIVNSVRGTQTIAVYQDHKTKKYQIDGRNTSKKKFSEYLACTLFSPELIEFLMYSPAHRRKFLDDKIQQVDIEYSDILKQYNKIRKQRNAYLKKIQTPFFRDNYIDLEDQQLLYWSDLLATASEKIIKKRLNFIHNVNSNSGIEIKYESSIVEAIDEVSQYAFDISESTEISKASHLEVFSKKLKHDIATGYSNYGAHRDDWSIFTTKDIYKHGSRGEKRMAISELIFTIQKLYHETEGFFPTLLLDDISSELDQNNTEKIIAEARKADQQLILTAIYDRAYANIDTPDQLIELVDLKD